MNVIATERLILRPLEESDLASLVQAINNINIVRNTARIPFPYGIRDAEDFLALARKNENGTLRLSMVLKDEPSRVIGGAGYEGGHEDAELGYWVAEHLWGKGMAGEAARAVTAHAFANTGYDRIVAGYRLGNEASRRILVRLGFKPTHEEMILSRGLGIEVPVMRMKLTRATWIVKQGHTR